MKREISLEKQINAILKKSRYEYPDESDSMKVTKTRKTFYKFDPRFEEELRKRARNMFRKKPITFTVPPVQKILYVFSQYRGRIKELVNALDKCSKEYYTPLTDIGVSKGDARTLYRYNREIEYALSIMPASYN